MEFKRSLWTDDTSKVALQQFAVLIALIATSYIAGILDFLVRFMKARYILPATFVDDQRDVKYHIILCILWVMLNVVGPLATLGMILWCCASE